MNNKPLTLAVAVIGAVFGATATSAQAAQGQPASAPTSNIAKPSPYQGVSQPPADDVITTSDEQSTPAVSTKPAPVVNPAPSPTVADAAPSPEVPEDADDSTDSDSVAAAAPRLSRDRSRTEASDADPDRGVVTYVPGPANALPEGTVFSVSMSQDLRATQVVPGMAFRAKLSQNLMHNGRVVVPIGSELSGKVISASYGHRFRGASVIHLRADEFILPDGTHYHLHAQVIDTKGSDTKPNGEGGIASKGHGKRAITEMAVTTGGGALIGAELGGPAGAAVGSAIGAGFMGAHLLLANQSVYVPEQSIVIFSLTDPMFLTPSRD